MPLLDSVRSVRPLPRLLRASLTGGLPGCRAPHWLLQVQTQSSCSISKHTTVVFIELPVILYHQIENPLALPLFRFAVFICGDLPFTRSPDLGVDVTEQYIKDGVMHGDVVNEPEKVAEMKRSASGRSSLELNTDSGYTSDEEAASARIVRRFVPEVDKERIQIPTAHVYGAQDVDLKKSLALVEMCDEELRETYMHQGGHDIPRAEDVHQDIMKVVEAASVKSETMC